MGKQLGLIIGILGVVVLTNVHAQENSSGSEGPEAFAKQYVQASNSNDLEKCTALIHPASRACITPENKFFFDTLLEKHCKNIISSDYKISISDIKPNDIIYAFNNMVEYPVKPTQQIQISYLNTETYVKTTTVIPIAYDGNQWFEVMACPKPETVEKMKTKAQEEHKKQQSENINLSSGEQVQIFDFVQKAVVQALNFQQGDNKSFDDAQENFSPEGWVAFKKKMQEGYLDSKGEIAYSLSFAPSREPKIIKRMDDSVFVRLPGSDIQKNGSSQAKYTVVVEVKIILGSLKIASLEVSILTPVNKIDQIV